ncbi:unnamed protein product [Durusdinium trenchii]|uniref:Prolyl 4-hydroxylase alpha subunit Fe(2+) 2OG dioxygenase domain-containing protein n=1 Tax=Durusdinium trenchii TaxID=1381693 RepID=A0ABP0MJN2_9DINO
MAAGTAAPGLTGDGRSAGRCGGLQHLDECMLPRRGVEASARGSRVHGEEESPERFDYVELESHRVCQSATMALCQLERRTSSNSQKREVPMTPLRGCANTWRIYSAAISACGKGQQWQQAIFLIARLQDQQLEADVVAYSATMSGCAKAGQWQQALLCLDALRGQQLLPDLAMLSAVTNALGKGQEWTQALAWLASTAVNRYGASAVISAGTPWQRSLSFGHIAGAQNAILASCGQQRHWRWALDALERSQRQNGEVDAVTGNSLVGACTGWPEAFWYLASFPWPQKQADVKAYTAALEASLMTDQDEAKDEDKDLPEHVECPRVSHSWPRAMDLLCLLRQRQVEANLRVWTKLLSVPALWRTTLALLHVDDDVGSAAEAQLRPLAARNRPWQIAVGLVHLPQPAMLEHEMLELAACNAAIRSCADASAWPCALELLERWRSRADLWTYSSTIVACGRGDQWQHSMAVLSRMEEVRLSADLIAMSATISSCAAAAQWQRALRYLVELPQAKLEADAMTYHAVTSALVKGESLELAMKLLEQMSSASMANESWKTRDETCAKEVTYSRVIHLTVSREDDEDKADKFGSPGQAEGQRPVWATDQRNGQRIEVTPTYSVAVHGRRAVAAALGASAPLRRPSASRTAGTAVLGSASSSAPPGLVEALAQAGLGGTAASEAALRHVAERRAEELVEHLEEVVGEGKLLDAGWLQMGKEEIRKKLAEIFTGYLLEIHQIVQVSDVFNDLSVPCRTWRRPWADALVAAHHARQLWAPHLAVAQDFSQLNALGLGCIVLDGMVPPQLAADAHAELEQMAQDGKLSDFSQSTCNPGSRHLWLRFAGPGSDGDGLVPPALATLGDALAGLPGALEERAREVQLSSPRLRIVPNLMAATYGPGSHYVPHKDMYSGGSCGFENTRMLTILCYLNPHWRPGDGGELRVFNTLREAPASPVPSATRK